MTSGGGPRTHGVVYDAGVVFRGPGYRVATRPDLDRRVLRREAQILRDEVHASAVRVVASDARRLDEVASTFLETGLDVWYSPAVFNYGPAETARRLVEMAEHAERLRARAGTAVTFVAGSELSLFMSGLLEGADVAERLHRLRDDPTTIDADDLSLFLDDVVDDVRRVFAGPLSYAALPFERIDWSRFDLVGVDHYRDDRVKDRYLEVLAPHVASGRPVVVTEVGMATYEGAAHRGFLGTGITDLRSVWLHQLPLVGRLVRVRNRPGFVRDEAAQAREIDETLDVLEGSEISGWFVTSFSQPAGLYDPDPRYDLDMGSMSLVKGLARGVVSRRWPDLPLDAKEVFDVVARHYASTGDAPGVA